MKLTVRPVTVHAGHGPRQFAPQLTLNVSQKMKKDQADAMRRIPTSSSAWLKEIAFAYLDAFEAIPYGVFFGDTITENDLFHVAPNVCLKFRGITPTKARVKKMTDAMLSSYVATHNQSPDVLVSPHIVFSFGYLASHFAIDLLSESTVADTMDYIEDHQEELARAIERGKKLANQAL